MCDRAIFLSEGRVVIDGTTEEVIQSYEKESRLDIASWATGMVGSDPTRCPIHIQKFELLNEAGRPSTLFQHGERIRLRLHYVAKTRIENPNFNVSFIRSDSVACCNYNTSMDHFRTGTVLGEGVVELFTPPIKLVSDLYSINVMVWDSQFQRLYCAQVGKNFHVAHPVLNSEFGVFRETGEWAWCTSNRLPTSRADVVGGNTLLEVGSTEFRD